MCNLKFENMKTFELYKDLRGNAVYLVNKTFYLEQGSNMEPAPKFLQSWFKKWIEEKRTDLIIKTNFNDFTIVSTKENH